MGGEGEDPGKSRQRQKGDRDRKRRGEAGWAMWAIAYLFIRHSRGLGPGLWVSRHPRIYLTLEAVLSVGCSSVSSCQHLGRLCAHLSSRCPGSAVCRSYWTSFAQPSRICSEHTSPFRCLKTFCRDPHRQARLTRRPCVQSRTVF